MLTANSWSHIVASVNMMPRHAARVRAAAGFVLPDHWVCTNCESVEWREREILCWGCGIGEMMYRGDA